MIEVYKESGIIINIIVLILYEVCYTRPLQLNNY